MLKSLLKTIYIHFVNFVETRRGQLRRRRSMRALEKLDDRLLDDIGLCRSKEGELVSIKSGAAVLAELKSPSLIGTPNQNSKRKTRRSRHPYLLRRRL